MTRSGSGARVSPDAPTFGEALAFLVITAGIGSFWVAAGGGPAAMVGLLLAFAGDVIRLVLRVGRGLAAKGARPASVPVAPFVVLGLAASEGLWRILQIEPSPRLAEALRLAAGFYALGILWSGAVPSGADAWRRILILQTGIAQSLLLGIPLVWLIRPTALEAGRPQVAGWVGVLSALAWLVCAFRLLRGSRAPAAWRVVILGSVVASGTFLGAVLAVILKGFPAYAEAFLRLALIVSLVLSAAGTTAVWVLGGDRGGPRGRGGMEGGRQSFSGARGERC